MILRNAIGEVSGSIEAKTRFTTRYRTSSVLQGGSRICAAQEKNEKGSLVFTTGEGGIVRCYADQVTTQTGVEEIPCGLRGNEIICTTTPEGQILCFAAAGKVLSYSKESKPGSRILTEPREVELPLAGDNDKIEAMFVKTIREGAVIALLVSTQIMRSNQLLYAVIQEGAPKFIRTEAAFYSTQGCLLGDSLATLRFAVLDGCVVTYGLTSGELVRYDHSPELHVTAALSVRNGDGADEIFALVPKGKTCDVAHVVLAPSTKAYTLTAFSTGNYFQFLDGVLLGDQIHLTALSADNVLYHSCFQPKTGAVQTFVNIADNVGRVSIGMRDREVFFAYAVSTVQDRLGAMAYSEQTSNWTCEWLELDSDKEVMEYPCYTTDIFVYDETGHPASFTPVTLSAETLTKLETAKGVHWLDAFHNYVTTTDATGKISVTQETASVMTAAIKVQMGFMHEGERVEILPCYGQKTYLQKLQKEELSSAKTFQDGTYQPLLLEKYRRDEKTVEALTNALNASCRMDGRGYVALSRPGLRKGITPPDESWSLTFDGDHASFSILSEAQAVERIRTIRANAMEMGVTDGFFSRIGDFFRSLGHKLVKVVEVVVATVKKVVKAVVEFVVEGVTCFLEQVIQLAEEVMDLVEIVFERVEVMFSALFGWLGELIGWDNILRCKRAISHVAKEGLAFLEGGADGLNQMIQEKIGEVQQDINTFFDGAIASILGTTCWGDATNQRVQGEENYRDAAANNFVLEHLASGGGVASLELTWQADGLLEDIIARLEQIAESCMSDSSFQEAADYFKYACTSVESFFSCTAAALLRILQGMLNLAIEGLKAVFDLVFQAVKEICQLLRKLFTQEIKLPFLSTFYRWLTGGDTLSILDVCSLVVAFPSTPICKLVTGKAPFPTEESLQHFYNNYSAKRLLAASGLITATNAGALGACDIDTQKDCKQLEAMSVLAYYGMSAFADAGLGGAILGGAQLVTEILWQSFSCPWIYENGSLEEKAPKGPGRKLWCFCWLGIVLDGGWYIKEFSYPDTDDTGRVLSSCYGLLHVMPLMASYEGCDFETGIANSIPAMTEISKLLLIDEVVVSTKTITRWIAVVIDAAAAISLFILTLDLFDFQKEDTGAPAFAPI